MRDRIVPLATLFLSALLFSIHLHAGKALSDADVKKAVIAQSISNYSGNCPCPYNSAKNGSACGKRSAWSRAGGAAPICYANEVTDQMVSDWRKLHSQ